MFCVGVKKQALGPGGGIISELRAIRRLATLIKTTIPVFNLSDTFNKIQTARSSLSESCGELIFTADPPTFSTST